ncbi:MAG TPA: GGDEF domain-containing protein [Terracidiphilus sp.]|nr:GGDEF domain-containing protein [Terracidiphilus sp.]
MLVQATLLIQDIQLLCFTIVFGVLALQRWNDPVRRWLWFGFLANAVGAVFDLLGAHLPLWIGSGLDWEMIPLSYALTNFALAHFDRRGRLTAWASSLILAAALPVLLLWSRRPSQVQSSALGDLLIALECIISIALLFGRRERSTRAPRLLMGGFLAFFVVVEMLRVWVAFATGADPDAPGSRLALVSVVTYIVNVSLLPLAFIWMMQARTEWELLQQSIADPLTGVLNRRGLEQAFERELAHCRRSGQDITLAMFDLDHFKQINDAYGHAGGDEILSRLGQFLINRLRETDVVGRFGGEEFVLLLPRTSLAESGPIFERLCEALRAHTGLLPATGVRITASIGIACTGGRRAVTSSTLLHEADVALYRAKENGRDQVCFFPPSGSVSLSSPDRFDARPEPEPETTIPV